MKDSMKKTAQNSLAPTSGEQSITNSKSSISEFQARGNEKVTKELDARTLTEIFDTAFKPRIPVIDGLLYKGIYLYVGPPKFGKSFAMAQIGYHVSRGFPLWGFPVNKGSVLYFALEDNFQRIQERLSRMYGIDGTEDFYFVTESNTLGDGLEQQILSFLQEHKNTQLVILDTLQKVREATGMNYSYANDYEVVTKLKRIADEYNICILVVHHTRKMEAPDAFDAVSGTNGLMGAADGAFVIQKERRTSNKATIDIAGRDQQDQRLFVEFDREKCIWNLIDKEVETWEEKPDILLESIDQLVTEHGGEWRGSPTELLQSLLIDDLKANTLTRKLNILVDKLYKNYNIIYENIRTHETKVIILHRQK